MQHCRDNNLKIKKFGQVFSGKHVADLLVSLLPDGLQIDSVIDPMVGRGDLLLSVYNKYSHIKRITGIDIDPDVIELCSKVIPDARIVIEDAFCSAIINGAQGWDLVITNPPYIRYQTLKTNPEVGLPDGEELRKNLTEHIQNSLILNQDEKALYIDIAKNYSGLSDMAVPSWILCASLVRQGGYLAMVAPETWLNRDYALPIHYLLLRCFEITVIVKDTESVWFDNAEVRTCLVVARRKRSESLMNSYKKTVFLELDSSLAGSESLVEHLVYSGKKGYDALVQIIGIQTDVEGNGYVSKTIPSMAVFPGLASELIGRAWIREEDRIVVKGPERLPKEMRTLVNQLNDIEYKTLKDFGWSVGQGMRTGANDFFYASVVSETETEILIQTEPWYGRQITIRSDNIRKGIKKRGDIEGLVVEYDNLKKCIVYIQDQVRKQDYYRVSQKVVSGFKIMDQGLSDYISAGDAYISPVHKKPFRELSAVKTNEKKSPDGFEKFWYMLPVLKERHMPDLCISRVCGNSAETIFVCQNAEKEIVVDANFITLWNSNFSSQLRAFALLNSTWAKVFLELIGTAMGGGALKIEASHVRKMVFPKLDSKRQEALEKSGRILLKEKNMRKDIQDQIDDIVLSPFGKAVCMDIKDSLRNLLYKKIKERNRRRKNDE